MATSKAKNRTSTKKVSKKKVSKKKVSTKKTKAATTSLGREGSVGHFFRHNIVNTKKTKADVLREARAKFTDKDIPDSYYTWYHNECKRKGLLSA